MSRLHPWSEPRSLREPGGKRIPSFSIGAKGTQEHEQTIRAAIEVREFRRSHRETRIAHRDGHRKRRFPFGTYALRTVHGAQVEPSPAPDAIVAQPGPLLCDVQERLRARDATPNEREQSIDLIERVREFISNDDAPSKHSAHMDFESTRPQASTTRQDDDVVTRHRFDRRAERDRAQHNGPEAARRLIVLRDRRMGRPARQTPYAPHGADPPG